MVYQLLSAPPVSSTSLRLPSRRRLDPALHLRLPLHHPPPLPQLLRNRLPRRLCRPPAHHLLELALLCRSTLAAGRAGGRGRTRATVADLVVGRAGVGPVVGGVGAAVLAEVVAGRRRKGASVLVEEERETVGVAIRSGLVLVAAIVCCPPPPLPAKTSSVLFLGL